MSPREIARGVYWLSAGKGVMRSNVYFARSDLRLFRPVQRTGRRAHGATSRALTAVVLSDGGAATQRHHDVAGTTTSPG